MFHTPRSRWTAAAVHLALSILLIGTIALLAFKQMYPAGLHHAAKLDKLMGIMLGVDIVAGPLLTLILYRVGKRGLKLDLAVIAILQLAFLSYGLNTLWKSRPLFLVGSQQAFALLFANEVGDATPAKAKKEHWPRFHGTGPWLVGVDLSSEVAKDEFLFSYLGGDAGPMRDEDLFVPYGSLKAQIAKAAKPLAANVPVAAGERDSLRSMMLMSARSKTSVVVVDARSGMPVRVVETVTTTLPPKNVKK
jgi:hypothetical protein